MTKRKKKSNSGKELVNIYEKITCLKKAYQDMTSVELLSYSNDIYNSVVSGMLPKRKVLLNELLDLETELRIRNKIIR